MPDESLQRGPSSVLDEQASKLMGEGKYYQAMDTKAERDKKIQGLDDVSSASAAMDVTAEKLREQAIADADSRKQLAENTAAGLKDGSIEMPTTYAGILETVRKLQPGLSEDEAVEKTSSVYDKTLQTQNPVTLESLGLGGDVTSQIDKNLKSRLPS